MAIADAARIDQAMLNLVTNAVQHTVDGDEIGIGARVAGERLRLWVRDTGPGVPAGARDHIFDRTARGAGSRSPDQTVPGSDSPSSPRSCGRTAAPSPSPTRRRWRHVHHDIPLDPEELMTRT